MLLLLQFVRLGPDIHLATVFLRSLEAAWHSFALNGFFIVFWALTLLAFVFPTAVVKRVYVAFLFTAMVSVSFLIKAPVWPLHQWRLWARLLPPSADYLEVSVKDAHGNQFVYDLRVAPPLNPAYLNKVHAPAILRARERGGPNVRATWLLDRANAGKPDSFFLEWMRFPEREYSHYQCSGLYENSRILPSWPEDEREFTSLVIKKKRVVFDDEPGCGAEFTTVEEVEVP